MSGRSPRAGGDAGERHPVEAVRTAAVGDVPRLSELVGELADAIGSQRGGPHLVDPEGSGAGGRGVQAWVASMVGNERAVVLVGTLDEVVVGLGVGHVDGPPGTPGHGVLDACFVEPGARGVGVGRLLLDAVVEWMAAHGARGMDGTALPGDRAAKNFYESAGFKARLLTMHRAID